jgi:GNAT superfamily N-acetyltransferase
LETRAATPQDAAAIAANLAEGLGSYREWAAPGWSPAPPSPADVARLQGRLADGDVWCLLAFAGKDLAGHVALALVTAEDPQPAPEGIVNLWQLFVREPWQGRGVAPRLMAAAVAEARRRGYASMRLWTPRGARRARRFYEREGWAPSGREREQTPSGLATVEYLLALGRAGSRATST